ncbi:hypothetical protein D8674_009962 [Pyrus ussuriensis x Pyrus communis]|uniref:Uncharacterized protein n=1 Tax=Pyrus ussuriensis x Pyrus communis TaxID=2448454 RepID=A0A5N5FCX7_9ROSA|nr:hypothetical protein D8674_009962 [Pyrus ussuriensis x Pyrus communis]
MMGLKGVFLTLFEELEESERFRRGKSGKSEKGSCEGAGVFFDWYKRYQYGGT